MKALSVESRHETERAPIVSGGPWRNIKIVVFFELLPVLGSKFDNTKVNLTIWLHIRINKLLGRQYI